MLVALLGWVAASLLQPSGFENKSIVVVGAHHFGRDLNDPLHGEWRHVAWHRAVLVEAQPDVARQLYESIQVDNPFWKLHKHRVHVLNEGVCNQNVKGSSSPTQDGRRTTSLEDMPFYSLQPANKSERLHWDRSFPTWSQLSSFKRSQLEKEVAGMALNLGKGEASLLERINEHWVHCSSLPALMGRIQSEGMIDENGVGLLIIDIEGLDCETVYMSGAEFWCSLQPSLLLYEIKHCSRTALQRARSIFENLQCQQRNGSSIVRFTRFPARSGSTRENDFWRTTVLQ